MPATTLIDLLDATLDALGGAMRLSLADFIDLETADDATTLVTRQGAMLSAIDIDGYMGMVASQDDLANKIVDPLNAIFENKLSGPGHQILFWFEADSDGNMEAIRRTHAATRATAERLGMSMDDMFEAQYRTIDRYIVNERKMLLLWTTPAAMNRQEQTIEKKERATQNTTVPPRPRSQDPARAHNYLRTTHRAWVETVVERLQTSRFRATLMDVRDLLRAQRASLDPDRTGPDWRASLPGDPIHPSVRKRQSARTQWDGLYPPLAWQITPGDARVLSHDLVSLGNRVYAPMTMELFPARPTEFGDLYGTVRQKGIPFRMAFLVEGGGNGLLFRRIMASALSFHASNRLISEAFKDLDRRARENNEAITPCRVAFATWAPAGADAEETLRQVRLRASGLANAITAWGGAQVNDHPGDPLAGLVSASPGLMSSSIANVTAFPLRGALSMMPWLRPSSPFRQGSLLMVSPEGRLMPMEMFSTRQSTWITLLYAPPGAGKSVQMQMMHQALVLAAGNTELPRIAIIDVGFSARGLIEMLQARLPPALRHQVIHRRLRMSADESINIFDTFLGARFPTPLETNVLRNIVGLMMTPTGASVPVDPMPGLIEAAIQETYMMRSDRQDPNMYATHVVPEVDAAIRDLRWTPETRTTWWDVVDILFNAGRHHEAALAQRYAVPVFSDLARAVATERVRSAYAAAKTPTGEPVVDAFTRILGEQSSMFPNLTRPTRFALGDARIVALDLDEVVKGQGAIGKRITEIMYLIARYLPTKDFYIDKDTANDVPAPPNVPLGEHTNVAALRAYHTERGIRLRAERKRVCFDELHVAGDSALVIGQIERDCREGRKYNVDVVLASQRLEDFSPTIVNLATTIFVMGGPDEKTADRAAQQLGLAGHPGALMAIRRSISLPRPPHPGVFLGVFKTTDGIHTQRLALPLGPIELWSFNTASEDAALRNALVARLGIGKALAVLAHVYPGGTARPDISARREQQSGSGAFDGAHDNVLDTITQELIDVAPAIMA